MNHANFGRPHHPRSFEAIWKTNTVHPPDYIESASISSPEQVDGVDPFRHEDGIADNIAKINKNDMRVQSFGKADYEDDQSKQINFLISLTRIPKIIHTYLTASSIPNQSFTGRMIARYIYPPERGSSALQSLPNDIHQSHTEIMQLSTLSSFFVSLPTYIASCFIEDIPAIIEYSNLEMQGKINDIEIKAQVVEIPASTAKVTYTLDRVVSIVALVPTGNGEEHHAVTMTAKPKRIRQLLREYGVRSLEEDVYRPQIMEALKQLG